MSSERLDDSEVLLQELSAFGAYVEAGLRLRFSGGSIGGITLSTGVPIPQMGEQGIYFVRSLSKPGANPLVGWSQGHFTIDADNAVRAGNGAIVTDIRAARSGATVEISEGLARGFSAVNPSGAEIVPVRALSPEEFKYRIRELWQGGPVVREAAQASTAVPQTTAEPAKPAKDPALWASETPAE